MAAPPAYLDECVDHNLVAALRGRGFQITSALEQGRANVGDADPAQLDFATSRGWVLISHNEIDFRRLSNHFRQQHIAHAGIIILPDRASLGRMTIRAAMMLDWLGTMADHRSGYFKWGQFQGLLEQGYRLPGYDEVEVRRALAR